MENDNWYTAKMEARAEALRDRAARKKAQADALLNSARADAEHIPMGQPILVGHHSEARHRRDLDRIHSRTDKGFTALKEAHELERRVDAAENNTAISSDDPEAVDRLREKLAGLEKKREDIKDYNKRARKEGKETTPAYLLTNLGANIRTVKARIEHLEARANMLSEEVEVNGVRIVTNVDANRLQVFFEGKPTEEIRMELKRNGFKWSRAWGCWQRWISAAAMYEAERIANAYQK